jgi:NDP-sugar pyrophosphorylase family protein
MQIVIPMSGAGSRFVAAGYSTLKPLIEVEGKPIVEHVVNMFPGERDFIFICAADALARTSLRQVLQRICPTGKIVSIEPHKRGPVHAVLQARALIRPDSPVIVNYCDFSVQWDYPDFRRKMAELGCAGAITAYRGFHPHSLGPNLYAYLRHRENYLLEIREKHCFTQQRMQEYASTGTYYFRSGELLLRYYDQAVALDLQTNGEYYGSSPYNLLVRDGLDVFVYEVQRFFQWGTPEDLEEYLGWSNYFLKSADHRPRMSRKGATLITMAGSGARFAKEGYTKPKPLIEVDGEPMMARALNSLPPVRHNVIVCRPEHAQHPSFQPALAGQPKTEVVIAESPTAGQACTCLLAKHHLDPDESVLLAPCDTVVSFDEQEYQRLTSSPDVDCLVWTFSNHPHANRNPQQYAWTVLGENGLVQDILGKQPPAGDVRKASGVSGLFWFRRAADLFTGAEELIASGQRVNNEFYVDLVIPILVRKGLKVLAFPLRHYICLGTPEDVQTYEYWVPYFRALQAKTAGAAAR